mmetsp:Transcript_11467/g.30686  ORF Transcript_11467/g.30686 Transcript_11467/m.30686 type:complete len:337 (+) Transcript_11467:225-1235(+)
MSSRRLDRRRPKPCVLAPNCPLSTWYAAAGVGSGVLLVLELGADQLQHAHLLRSSLKSSSSSPLRGLAAAPLLAPSPPSKGCLSESRRPITTATCCLTASVAAEPAISSKAWLPTCGNRPARCPRSPSLSTTACWLGTALSSAKSPTTCAAESMHNSLPPAQTCPTAAVSGGSSTPSSCAFAQKDTIRYCTSPVQFVACASAFSAASSTSASAGSAASASSTASAGSVAVAPAAATTSSVAIACSVATVSSEASTAFSSGDAALLVLEPCADLLSTSSCTSRNCWAICARDFRSTTPVVRIASVAVTMSRNVIFCVVTPCCSRVWPTRWRRTRSPG